MFEGTKTIRDLRVGPDAKQMKKGSMNDIFGRNKLNKPLKIRCPFCKHIFPPEIIQIIGITEEPIKFVILACPNAKCRTILEIIPHHSVGTVDTSKQNNK